MILWQYKLLSCWFSSSVQQGEESVQLSFLCMSVDACCDNHVKELEVVSDPRDNLLS